MTGPTSGGRSENTDPSGLITNMARWITGPNICATRCGPRQEYSFDGVPIDGAFAPQFAGLYGMTVGTSDLASDVWKQLRSGERKQEQRKKGVAFFGVTLAKLYFKSASRALGIDQPEV